MIDCPSQEHRRLPPTLSTCHKNLHSPLLLMFTPGQTRTHFHIKKVDNWVGRGILDRNFYAGCRSTEILTPPPQNN